jgi:hypothetical protein
VTDELTGGDPTPGGSGGMETETQPLVSGDETRALDVPPAGSTGGREAVPGAPAAAGQIPAGGRIPEGVGDALDDAKRLVIAYVTQRTVVPLKGLGRFVLFGATGSLLLGAGSVVLLVGVLRLLQSETDGVFVGYSWLPYLITTVVAIVGIGVAATRIRPGARR